MGITVDELLQTEKLDEERLYQEYEKKAKILFRDGKRREVLTLTQEAYSTEHRLASPLIDTWHIDAAPDDSRQITRMLADVSIESNKAHMALPPFFLSDFRHSSSYFQQSDTGKKAPPQQA